STDGSITDSVRRDLKTCTAILFDGCSVVRRIGPEGFQSAAQCVRFIEPAGSRVDNTIKKEFDQPTAPAATLPILRQKVGPRFFGSHSRPVLECANQPDGQTRSGAVDPVDEIERSKIAIHDRSGG